MILLVITSLNTTIDDTQMEFFIQELDERNEMICVLNACGAAFNPCLGQACGAACIGITICIAGAHIAG